MDIKREIYQTVSFDESSLSIITESCTETAQIIKIDDCFISKKVDDGVDIENNIITKHESK